MNFCKGEKVFQMVNCVMRAVLPMCLFVFRGCSVKVMSMCAAGFLFCAACAIKNRLARGKEQGGFYFKCFGYALCNIKSISFNSLRNCLSVSARLAMALQA